MTIDHTVSEIMQRNTQYPKRRMRKKQAHKRQTKKRLNKVTTNNSKIFLTFFSHCVIIF